MGKGRLEAFSDGVIAVIITIMVLELKTPTGPGLAALEPVIPSLLTYVISFLFVGIYWNNHHHLLHAAEHVSGPVLWANLHVLFWLSLAPFVTGWVGRNAGASVPTAIYGVIFLMSGVAWLILQRTLIAANGSSSMLARAVGRDFKGKASAVLYVTGIVSAFVRPWIADLIYLAVALMWLVPDRRIERIVHTR